MCRASDCAIFRGKAIFCDRCGGAHAHEPDAAQRLRHEKSEIITVDARPADAPAGEDKLVST